MKDIKQVYLQMQQKKRKKNELGKMIRDALSVHPQHKELTEELKRLREKKKSVENQVMADCLAEADQIDLLKLEISAANELLSDIALSMYVGGQTVEIVDEERGVKLTPTFSVKFQKENLENNKE